MTYLYIYRLSTDKGLAPCVQDGLLSLACCKGGRCNGVSTGIRYWIGSKLDGTDYSVDDIYLLGLYRSKFLYLAKVTDVVTMTEYYQKMSKDRADDIYSLENGQLIRNNKLRKEGIHLNKDDNTRDILGKYVLLSNDYIYLGKDAVKIDIALKNAPGSRGQRLIQGDIAKEIIKECLKYRDGKEHLPNEPLKKKCHSSTDNKGKVCK